MERNLATIQLISALDPITGADKIEKATILGWECVVKKGDFAVGDKCIFIEIDSVLPAIPYWDFMAPRRYRVKTIRLRKQVSQGLAVPLKDLLELKDPKVGTDVTEILGIVKWESKSDRESNNMPRKKHGPIIKFLTRFSWYRKLTHTKSKSFPNWIAKTDETRIQNLPWTDIYNKRKDETFYSSEKMDGQSATYWYIPKMFLSEFGICSRSVRKFEMDNSNWSRAAKELKIKDKLKLYPNTAIQGELCGPGIQGNKYNFTEFKLFIFNVFDIKLKRYYDLHELEIFCLIAGLSMVPILSKKYKLKETVQETIKDAIGESTFNHIKREGIVIRTHNQSISFKAINPEFLLKYEEEE